MASCGVWQAVDLSSGSSSVPSAAYAVFTSQEEADLLLVSSAVIQSCRRSSWAKINCRWAKEGMVEENLAVEVDWAAED